MGDGSKRLPFDLAMTTMNKTGSHFTSEVADTIGSQQMTMTQSTFGQKTFTMRKKSTQMPNISRIKLGTDINKQNAKVIL